MELLEKINFKKTYLKKSSITSGDQSLITLTYNNKRISFHYHDNYFNKSSLKDFLYALIMDSEAYSGSYNFIDFCNNYGYDSDSIKSLKIYNACKKQYDRFNKLFNESEQQQLQEYFTEY